MSLTTRENLIYNEISSGNVPNFYRNLIPVTSTATIGGVSQSVTYYVIPDYLAVGHDTDYFLCPMSPMLVTRIGTLAGYTLPTRKMVNDIWTTATVKLTPSPIAPGPSMTTVPVFNQHNTTVKGQRQSVVSAHPLGELVSGDKKDVVISNMIYTTANRVVIYGWIQPNGSPIQPMTNVHADTYMDYSHGIRLVQNSCMLNGTTSTTVQAILQSNTLNPLLSDEGVISQPQYPYGSSVPPLAMPTSFAVLRNTSTSLILSITNDPNATDYKVYTSTDGITYNSPLTLPKSNLVIGGLTTNTLYFIKIAAYNTPNSITSQTSEVLAGVPSAINDSVLIVNGFDRQITGNTNNFVIQHGSSFFNNNRYLESASNEAVKNGLVSLLNYKTVDYILGEESHADTTFTPLEQQLVSSYLKQGGHFFVSGSEIAWDMDHLGTAADKSFFNNFLKASYVSDSPNNQVSVYYSAYSGSLSNSIFNVNDSMHFDNGTHGTYNVAYPDVVSAVNGGLTNLHYASSINDIAGVHYKGMFNAGTKQGKLVYLCFPFETIYPSAGRDSAMKKIIEFFDYDPSSTSISSLSETTSHMLVFPHPSSDKAKIIFNTTQSGDVNIDLIEISSGKVIRKLYSGYRIEGNQSQEIDVSEIAAGTYVLSVQHIHQGIIGRIPFVIIH